MLNIFHLNSSLDVLTYSDLFALDFNTECSYLNTWMIKTNKKNWVKTNVKDKYVKYSSVVLRWDWIGIFSCFSVKNTFVWLAMVDNLCKRELADRESWTRQIYCPELYFIRSKVSQAWTRITPERTSILIRQHVLLLHLDNGDYNEMHWPNDPGYQMFN